MPEIAMLEFRPYQRFFKQPLQTGHGQWKVRRGIVLRLSNAVGQVGWGEIAPIEWFGSESYSEAIQFCQSLANQAVADQITLNQIQQIPSALSACRFGFEAAWEELTSGPSAGRSGLAASILLPTGSAALAAPQLLRQSGTFKWKIGVEPMQAELRVFEELIGLLPAGSKLRLDANGGLTWRQACQWLQLCDGYGIEFLEQPLPPDQFDLLLKLSQRHVTPIGLDESVCTLPQLQDCWQRGWRGIYIIKAAIIGSPMQLREFCQAQRLDLVWSSAFETAIARRYIENHLIARLPASERASGFGVGHWFSDGWEQRGAAQIWQQLKP